MRKTFLGILIFIVLTLPACAPKGLPSPVAIPPAVTPAPSAAPTETPSQPALAEPIKGGNGYFNESFGLGFIYPKGWFGPEEYTSDQTLRVEVGSDRVYPYGTDPSERSYDRVNSYSIVVQYTRGAGSPERNETYQVLAGMKEGEEVSNARSTTIKIRELKLGQFKGFEFITTLSMTASMQPFYSREVILIDDGSNLLTIFGSPNNVEIPPGEGWREIFESIDADNRPVFHSIVESLSVE